MLGTKRSVVFGAVAAASVTGLGLDTALAGGFAVREQSVVHQGAAFAGNAAGTVASSQFWNPATLGNAGYGFATESGYAAIYSQNELTATGGTLFAFQGQGFSTQTDTGGWALVPSSYASYRLSDTVVLGIGLNAPFGLGSEPDDNTWVGAQVSRSAKMTTYNLNPNVAYKIAPGLHVGAGLQIEYADLRFKFAGQNPGTNSAVLDVDDTVGFGFTLGAMWQPTAATTVGLGFRSSITHDFEGDLQFNGQPAAAGGSVKAELELPETVTLSLRQAFSKQLRGMATVEWTNWSRLDEVPVVCTSTVAGLRGQPCQTTVGANVGILDANWDDGWYYSLGMEYDYQPGLTLRAGAAYEQSPIRNATGRLYQVPDSDRVWLSGGFSYKIFENATLDFAYTHIFLEDATVDRGTLTSPATNLVSEREASVDIISVGYRMQWGGRQPLK